MLTINVLSSSQKEQHTQLEVTVYERFFGRFKFLFFILLSKWNVLIRSFYNLITFDVPLLWIQFNITHLTSNDIIAEDGR